MFQKIPLKLFSLFIIFQYLIIQNNGCRLIVPPELLNGCIFDPMIVSVSHSGYTVKRENCNAIVSKDVFGEQPLVYYGRARSVCKNKQNQIVRRQFKIPEEKKKTNNFQF